MKGTTAHFDAPYNGSESDKVGIVNETNDFIIQNHEKPPTKSNPNSVTRIYKKGKLIRERYYDENGDVYLDIDYDDHGNPKTHPVVPHQHEWHKNEKGIPVRNKLWEEINHDKATIDRVG